MASQLVPGPQADVLKGWLASLEDVTDLRSPNDVYAGRGFKLAQQAARTVGATISVISAGLGFITGPTKIPSYDLTISAGTIASVQSKIAGRFDPTSWWNGIQHGPFASPLTVYPIAKSNVLVALSEPYAKMIAANLAEMAAAGCGLRLFGSNLANHLPDNLERHVMPYDERLSQIASGTKADFPQRALLHYADNIASRGLDLKQERKAVLEAMASVGTSPRAKPIRARRSDDEIAEIIKQVSPTVGRSKSKLLSHLRREMGIACEQDRFSRIFKEVGVGNGH